MNYLENIVEHKKEEISIRKRNISTSELERKKYFSRETYSFLNVLKNQKERISVIAEIKRMSPSVGRIANGIDITRLAKIYEHNGAAAISVLTDEKFFSGSLDDLETVRPLVKLPLLRKDFIIDEYQIYEAKAYGADMVLLIADILEEEKLGTLFRAVKSLGMESLVEVYSEDSVHKINFDEMKLIGINNRDLRDFTINLEHTRNILQKLPQDIFVISESGIQNSDDIQKLKSYGVNGVLIGESLMRAENSGALLMSFASI